MPLLLKKRNSLWLDSVYGINCAALNLLAVVFTADNFA